jgi:hypothetical protein
MISFARHSIYQNLPSRRKMEVLSYNDDHRNFGLAILSDGAVVMKEFTGKGFYRNNGVLTDADYTEVQVLQLPKNINTQSKKVLRSIISTNNINWFKCINMAS